MSFDSENKEYLNQDVSFDANDEPGEIILDCVIDDEENEAILIDDSKLKKKNNRFLIELYEWVQSIAVALVVALIINQFLFAIVRVDGASMQPTLLDSERLIITKLFYKPEPNDIVIVKSDVLKKHIVKRVIATEGQEIYIDAKTGDVYVDNVLLDEPFIKEKINPLRVGTKYDYPLVVPEGTVFVMGDNRNNSQDSRSIGVIPLNEIVGKASLRILPLDKFGGLYDDVK
jgi:signal peptidase I